MTTKKILIIAGFGPGISTAVAEKFGKQGFTLALVARNEARLKEGVAALAKQNIEAHAFPADLGKAESVEPLISRIRAQLGSITAIEWTAYGSGAGDLSNAPLAELRNVFEIPIVSLTAAIQALLPDLRANKGAVLVTNGGLGFFDAQVDAVGVQWGAMGLSIANSAKHKLVRLLSLKLKDQGVHVGEVIVTGIVKGSAFEQGGNGTVDANDVAQHFWDLFSKREKTSITH